MTKITDELIERQVAIEFESLAMGRERYMKQITRLNESGEGDKSRPANDMLHRLLPSVTEALDNFRATKKRTVATGRRTLDLIGELTSEEVAYILIRRGLGMVSKATPMTGAARSVGAAMLEEVQMKQWAEADPKYYQHTVESAKRHRTAHSRRKAARGIQRFRGIKLVRWTEADQVTCGMTLLDILIQTTGLWHAPMKKQGQKTTRMFMPTDKLIEWMDDAHERVAAVRPLRLPMVVPPVPWEDAGPAGYLTDVGGPIHLVKGASKAYLRTLRGRDVSQVYDALNRLQETPWRVNTRVLDVAQQLWQRKVSVGVTGHESLPCRSPKPVPNIPPKWEGKVKEWREKDIDGYKAWAVRAAAVHDENERNISKRVLCREMLDIAEMFRDDTIYFPHQLDFRGRAYPVPAALQPQGSDLARGLLMFADGKVIGERGAYWLKVHIANLFGQDKIPYADRVRWTDEWTDQLIESALDPLNPNAMWLGADEPFQALAACYELAGLIGQGPDEFVTHLPIGMDGSCNGLQHFSLLLRDSNGGEAVNLRPSRQPQDVYNRVAKVVAERVRKDAEMGGEDAEWARAFDGHITRSIVKQPCMTYCYGATKAGMRAQLESAIRKAGNPMGFPARKMWPATAYLAGVVREAIGEVVVAARDAMDWLHEAARVATKAGLPLTWTAPTGLPISQEYRKKTGRKLICHFGGQRCQVYLTRETTLSPTKQAAGLAPNFVHSLDASHMMWTVLLGDANGITSWGMVHDSYATHACDIDLLHTVLRAAVVEMYQTNWLEQLRDELVSNLPDEYAEKLPELPPVGDLELFEVTYSPYFFA